MLQVQCRPLGDGEEDGGRGWAMGLRYLYTLGETQSLPLACFCEPDISFRSSRSSHAKVCLSHSKIIIHCNPLCSLKDLRHKTGTRIGDNLIVYYVMIFLLDMKRKSAQQWDCRSAKVVA